MQRICFLSALSGASAMDLSNAFAERRVLQGSGNGGGNGGADVSICRWQLQHLDGTGPPNYIHSYVGTLHDDETDEEVDCTQPGVCGGAQAHGNGYGDAIDCHATISAPPTHTITIDFSYMNLESGAMCGDAHGGVGCDVVTLYDGVGITAPVIGVYSGTDLPPPIASTGNVITVRFETDQGNAAITSSDDPGFYLNWHFHAHMVTQGDGICPAPAVYTDAHGTIHDEAGNVNCNNGGCNGQDTGGNGYNDNTNCYTTIHAPADTQIRFTFTQLNLEEQGCDPSQPNGGCPEGGCDYVSIYDGQHNTDTLLGTYSGFTNGAGLASVVTTGEWMRVEFHTDVGNCGIQAGEDPGFVANWDFVENGQDICQPDSTVLTAEHGALHDDDVSSADSYDSSGTPGYGDNLDCGVRLRAPRGGTVNLHIVQMNLEGDGNGICDPSSPNYIGHSCDDNGGDFLKIYDGRDATAPLIASLNGQPTDAILAQDTYTSTGRNMYVHFESDTGNAGLSGTTATPGFWAEWTMLDEGQDCESFQETPGHGLVGHNNEQLTGMTAEQCMQACCARPWCESFDYMPTWQGGTCNLADVSYSQHQSSITVNHANNYYERPLASIPPTNAPLGANGCAARLESISDIVTAECCGTDGCEAAAPSTCTEQCAINWLPFSKQCSTWLDQTEQILEVVTENCEREEYGTFREGNNHGRCSDHDIDTYEEEVAAACCGNDGEFCTSCTAVSCESSWDMMPPMQNGAPVCSDSCRAFFEEVWAECHPRFETEDVADQLLSFLGLCQGMADDGGGSRRAMMTFKEPVLSRTAERVVSKPAARVPAQNQQPDAEANSDPSV